MTTRQINADRLGKDVDWEGNNAAFTCPMCSKVFLVSGMLHKEGRACPECGGSKAFVQGGRKNGGTATIEWDADGAGSAAV